MEENNDEPFNDEDEELKLVIERDRPVQPKSLISKRVFSIICFFILVVVSFFSVSWLSEVYLLIGCLYLAQILGPSSLNLVTGYAILILLAKITGVILVYTTSIFSDLKGIYNDLVYSLGFTFISKDITTILFCFSVEVFVIVGLIVIKKVASGMAEQEEEKLGSLLLCHVWFWLMISFLTVAYLLGNTLGYLAMPLMLIILLICWAKSKEIDSAGVWRMVRICTILTASIISIIYAGQVKITNRFPESLVAILGFNEFNSWRDKITIALLIGVYCCSVLYSTSTRSGQQKKAAAEERKRKSKLHERLLEDETRDDREKSIEIENKQKKSEEKLEEEKKEDKKEEDKSNDDKEVKDKEPSIKTKPISETLKGLYRNVWMLVMSTPFGLMLILRAYTIIWIIKYNGSLSSLIVFWNYFSISYTNVGHFCKLTPYFLITPMAAQIILTKFVEIPQMISNIFPSFLLKYINFIGCSQHLLDPDINATWEYFWMIAGLALVCACMKMMQYIPKYNTWCESEEKKTQANKCVPNNLEVAARFLLEHTDKLYIVLLYIVAFQQLNIIHTLLLLYFFFIMLLKNLARKCFILIIFIFALRTLGRFMVMSGYNLFSEYNSNLVYILKIIGIYVEDKHNAVIYKMGIDWEAIGMYFCSYVQLKIFRYILHNPFKSIPLDNASIFIKSAEYLNFLIQVCLLWIIYIAFILVLMYQDPSFFTQGYLIIIAVTMLVHVRTDVGDKRLRGYKYSKPVWTILAVYNTLILFASYVANFVIYVGEYNLKFDEYKLQLVKIIGLDFTQESEHALHATFLPQFVILYLGFFARQNALTKQPGEEIREVEYKREVWMWFVTIIDYLSQYSFHMLMMAIGLLGILYSFNFIMFIYALIFGIHYITLHKKYIQIRKCKIDLKKTYQERQDIIATENKEQKIATIYQRRLTLKFILLIAFLSFVLNQAFVFVQVFKGHIDQYIDENEYTIKIAETLEVLAYYLGMAGMDDPRTPLLILTLPSVIIIYLCALESRFISWHENRMGYKFLKEDLRTKQFSLMDIFKNVLAKFAIASARKLKYEMLMVVIIKTMLEYAIIGTFLFTATGKNNVLELTFIPIAIICMVHHLSLSISWSVSVYMWFWFFIQYLLCVVNLTEVAIPQEIDDTTFLRGFNLPKWPIYKIILTDWHPKQDWAYYFALGNNSKTRYFFILDFALFFLQAIYFQNFSHSFYNLSATTSDVAGISESVLSKNEQNVANYEVNPSRLMKVSYKFVKNILFVYSHIFTLFCLILMTSYTKGAINIFYLCLSVGFMQFDLFSNIGTKNWKLPIYFKYILKPYVFLDLTLQFIYQVPELIKLVKAGNHINLMSCIGIYNLNEAVVSIWIKALIFTLVLYQDRIYSSKEHKRVCYKERRNIRNLQKSKQVCMSYLHNNIKIQEFKLQKKLILRSHRELSMLKSRIDGWNEILHRKESKQNSHSETESGLLLDLEDSKQKLNRMKMKMEYLSEYPEESLGDTSILEKIYLWLYSHINHIFFMKAPKLNKLKEKLERGRHFFDNSVVNYHMEQYSEKLKEKMIIEKLKYEAKLVKLAIQSRPSDFEQMPIEKSAKPTDKRRRPFNTFQLILKIFSSIAMMVVSASQGICFGLMVLAHVYNGNILSFVYVMSIFGYALLIRCRPHYMYWKVMLLYTGIVVISKYFCDFIESIFVLYDKNLINTLNGSLLSFLSPTSGLRLGLFEGSKRGTVYFMMFDALVMLGIIFHMFILHSLGLLNKSEEKIETISQAMERIAKNNPPNGKNSQDSEYIPLEIMKKQNEEQKEEIKQALIEENKDLILEEKTVVKDKSKEEKAEEGFISKITKKVFFDHSCGHNLFPKLKNEKPGADYGIVLTILQVVFCAYIIAFCSNMNYDVTSLTKIKLTEFSGLTVIALLVQIALIFIERYLYFVRPLPSNTSTVITRTKIETSVSNLYFETYQMNNYTLMYRFIFHIFQLLLVHIMIFWYFPNDAGIRLNGYSGCRKADIIDGRCNEVPCNIFLYIFYILYCVYFAFSSLQIRDSWSEIEENFLTKSSSSIAKMISKIFFAIPFAWELKQTASWLWTKTSFDLFQWLKFEEISDQLFEMKCTAKSKQSTIIGNEVSKITKYTMGGGLLVTLIFLIVAPILVFSTLNPMVSINNPTKASLELTLNYDDTKSFNLLKISDSLIQDLSKSPENVNGLRNFEEIKGADIGQFSYISFANSSDDSVFPTTTKINDLIRFFKESIKYPTIVLKYTFVRPQPSQNQQIELTFSRQLNQLQHEVFGALFNKTQLELNSTNATIVLPKFFCKTVILSLDSKPAPVENWQKSSISSSDLSLRLSLDKFNKSGKSGDNELLIFSANNTGSAFSIYSVSEKSKDSLFAGYSIITLYISVVLVVGKLIRGAFSGTYHKIIYDDMPNPSPLLKLCAGVELARHENDLIKESELYYELIEVLRSTELIKLITKTSKEVYIFKDPNDKD